MLNERISWRDTSFQNETMKKEILQFNAWESLNACKNEALDIHGFVDQEELRKWIILHHDKITDKTLVRDNLLINDLFNAPVAREEISVNGKCKVISCGYSVYYNDFVLFIAKINEGFLILDAYLGMPVAFVCSDSDVWCILLELSNSSGSLASILNYRYKIKCLTGGNLG